MATGDNDLWSTKEAARHFNLSTSTIRKHFLRKYIFPEDFDTYGGGGVRECFYSREDMIEQLASSLALSKHGPHSYVRRIPDDIMIEATKMLNSRMPEQVQIDKDAAEWQKIHDEICLQDHTFLVESVTHPGVFHTVRVIRGEASCSCFVSMVYGWCQHIEAMWKILTPSPSLARGVLLWDAEGNVHRLRKS